MPPRGKKVLLGRGKATSSKISSTKEVSIEDIMLQEEEEAEKRLHSQIDSLEKDLDENISEDRAGNDGEQCDDSDDEVSTTRKRQVIVNDPEELEMLRQLRENKRQKTIITAPSSSIEQSSSDQTPSSLSACSFPEEHRSRQGSQKTPVKIINLQTNQLGINHLGVDSNLLTRIEKSPHFAGIISRYTNSKNYAKLADGLPRYDLML